jgi:hypothetical protein
MIRRYSDRANGEEDEEEDEKDLKRVTKWSSGTWNPEPETRDPELGTRNSEPGIRNPELGTGITLRGLSVRRTFRGVPWPRKLSVLSGEGPEASRQRGFAPGTVAGVSPNQPFG